MFCVGILKHLIRTLGDDFKRPDSHYGCFFGEPLLRISVSCVDPFFLSFLFRLRNVSKILETSCDLLSFYCYFNRLKIKFIRSVANKLSATFSLLDKIPQKKRVRSEKKVAALKAIVLNLLDLAGLIKFKNLWIDLGLLKYKVQLVQKFKSNNYLRCHRFATWTLSKLQEVSKIVFSHEPYFSLNGFVNKNTIVEFEAMNNLRRYCIFFCFLKGLELSAACILKILNHFVLKNEAELNVTANEQHYRNMIENWLFPYAITNNFWNFCGFKRMT